MTEQEYIDVSNLARVRSAMNVLSDFHSSDMKEQALMVKAYVALTKLEGILGGKVVTEYGEEDDLTPTGRAKE